MSVRQRNRRISKWGKSLVAVLIIILLTAGCTSAESRVFPRAAGGVLDLSHWDWTLDGIVPLSGEWRFIWKSDGNGPLREQEMKIEVPGMWDEAKQSGQNEISNRGYGEYHLTILHAASAEPMAIRVPNISTAYTLYVNGVLALSRGTPGMDETHTAPYQLPAIVYLSNFDSKTDLTLVVANFHHRHGGIRTDLLMGKSEEIDRQVFRNSSWELIVFGCLLMIGLYHVGLFALRRKETANLFFALICLSVALRTGLVGESFLVRLFPWLNWETAVRAEYIAFVLSGLCGIAYYQRMYPGEIRRLWSAAAGGAAAVLGVAAAFCPTYLFTSWLPFYQVYLLAICVIIFAVLLLSTYRGREGARLALAGMAGMAYAVVNDMLFYNGLWRSSDLVPFGLLFLIVMNSFIIAMRSSRTFDRAEQMSAELKEWNDKLEERITERTDELRKSYDTLEEAKTGLERMEMSRLQLVSNISHDLRTPITLLQGYLEALRDGVITDEGQRDSTIRLMLGKVEGLNGMIHDLFELSVLDAGRVELSPTDISLGEWKEHLDGQIRADVEEKKIGLVCDLESETDASAQVQIDIRRMDRVFANLIFNALRYTPKGGMIRISLHRQPHGRMAGIKVEDNGPGIDPEDLPFIFDRFYKKDKSRHSSSGGSGLGLAISREIVELHGGSIEAYNRAQGGGAFLILLPLR